MWDQIPTSYNRLWGLTSSLFSELSLTLDPSKQLSLDRSLRSSRSLLISWPLSFYSLGVRDPRGQVALATAMLIIWGTALTYLLNSEQGFSHDAASRRKVLSVRFGRLYRQTICRYHERIKGSGIVRGMPRDTTSSCVNELLTLWPGLSGIRNKLTTTDK